jgi:ketosteroid isomerase-like protein
MTHRQTVKQIANYFESISPASVGKIKELYAPTARFKDPFNDVKGIAEIERIFQHMFVSLAEPRFVVIEEIVDGSQAFLTWEFRLTPKRSKWC